MSTALSPREWWTHPILWELAWDFSHAPPDGIVGLMLMHMAADPATAKQAYRHFMNA